MLGEDIGVYKRGGGWPSGMPLLRGTQAGRARRATRRGEGLAQGVLDRPVPPGSFRRGSPSEGRRGRSIAAAAPDALAALLSGVGSWAIWTGALERVFLPWHAVVLVLLGGLWVAALAQSKALNNRLRRSLLDDLPLVLNRVLIVSVLMAFAVSLWWLDPNQAGLVLLTAAVGSVLLPVVRGLGYAISSRRKSVEHRVLIVGAGNIGARVARLLSEGFHPEMEVVGFLDKEPLSRPEGDDESGIPVLGSSYDLPEVLREYGVDKLIIAFSTAPHQRILEMIWECDKHGVEVSIVPRFFEATTVQSTVENVAGMSLMHLNRASLKGVNALLKRAFDLAATTAGLLVIWPLLLVLAVAIKLDSPGPLLFSQKRVGCDGRVFTLYKFRSMRTDAEALGTWTQKRDPRRTRVGRILRPLNLDELPQLFNVLKGDMSLVGPRPEQPSYVELFEESVYRYAHRHRVKSGITGWAQVNGLRGDTSIEERVLYDNFYIENWSLWLDIKILLLTFFKSGVSMPELGSKSRG